MQSELREDDFPALRRLSEGALAIIRAQPLNNIASPESLPFNGKDRRSDSECVTSVIPAHLLTGVFAVEPAAGEAQGGQELPLP